jgi:hypothetical protein
LACEQSDPWTYWEVPASGWYAELYSAARIQGLP